jgi:hypothetical protein
MPWCWSTWCTAAWRERSRSSARQPWCARRAVGCTGWVRYGSGVQLPGLLLNHMRVGLNHIIVQRHKSCESYARGFGWAIAHAAVSRRPPIPLYTIVARTHTYTYAANVWDSSLVQGPFSVAPSQTLVPIRNFCIAARHIMRAAATHEQLAPHAGVPGEVLALTEPMVRPSH